ncbi:MAG: copper resistance CopC family protein [Pseudonocardiaceae bacterium]
MRHALALLALAGLALLGGAGPASAHTQLIGSDPVDGSQLTSGPQRVGLTFNEPVQVGFSTVTVVGPDGNQWQAGTPTEVGAVVSVPVRPLGPAGEYTIGYRVLSADSHPVSGAVRFTLTEPGTGTGTGTAAPPSATQAAPGNDPRSATRQDGAMPVWPWVLAAVVLLVAGVAAALRVGRAR